jgi:hypothetical protein
VQGRLHVISGVELGGARSRRRGRGGLLVGGEGATILGLDCPQAALVVGLGPAVAADAAHELLVAAGSGRLRGHRGDRSGTKRNCGEHRAPLRRRGQKRSSHTPWRPLQAPPPPNPNHLNERNSSITVHIHSPAEDRMLGFPHLHHLL